MNNILRKLRKSSELSEEIDLLKNQLPSDVHKSRIKLTKFENNFNNANAILLYYKDIYTDYALQKLLQRFLESQEYEATERHVAQKFEVYKFGVIEKDGEKHRDQKDIQTVFGFPHSED